jgi:hypothetical protein
MAAFCSSTLDSLTGYHVNVIQTVITSIQLYQHLSLISTTFILTSHMCISDNGFSAEDYSLLGHSAVESPSRGPKFQRCVLTPTPPWWWRQYAPLKRSSTSTGLQGVVPQKAIFVVAAVRTWNLTQVLSYYYHYYYYRQNHCLNYYL